MTLTPLRHLRDRLRARLGTSYKFWRAILLVSVLVLAIIGVYAIGHGAGYQDGRSDAAIQRVDTVLRKLDQGDCRAQLAGPVNDAATKQTAAGWIALLAALGAPNDPSIQARLLEQYPGETIQQILADAVRTVLDENDRLLHANTKRGPDPVAQCRDGRPGS